MTRLSRLVWVVPLAVLLGQVSPGRAGDDPFPRRDKLSGDDLRKQLAGAPEVKPLTLADLNRMFAAYKKEIQATKTLPFDPAVLLSHRPDMASLPLRGGRTSFRGTETSFTLGGLSRKLHSYLDAATPKGALGARLSPEVLEQALLNEKRGKRPEWTRPEAIPALLQLLTGEDDRIRLMLVDLLAEIPGKASTQALAQRAVFDPAPEVRAAAIKVLKERRAADYRPVLLKGLRYSWPAAADHAAEALVALGDKDSVPRLIVLLKAPDPDAPFYRNGDLHVRELVRIRHTANCFMCHPYWGGNTNANIIGTRNPVRGVVPGVSFRSGRSAGPIIPVPPELTSGPNSVDGTLSTEVAVRADITYLRQDFSAQLPDGPKAEPARFDFVVRTRRLPFGSPVPKAKADYPQRDSVLFALRHLTGEDCGKDAAAWVEKFPRAEFDAQAEQLAEELIRAPASRRAAVLAKLKDSKGVLYTHALAYAIPNLSGKPQRDARAALAERLTRMKPATLRDDLACDEPEIQRAAAKAVALRGLKELLPDLQALAQDDDPDVAQEAASAVDLLK